jgi:hypothetical protein
MSKRRRPAGDGTRDTARDAAREADHPRERRASRDPTEAPGPRGRSRAPVQRDIAILAAAFGIGVGVAELLGAPNLGVAFGVGQLVFAVVLVVLLTRD